MKHSVIENDVPRETFSAIDGLVEKNRSDFEAYLDQLLWWNKRVNLVSRNVPRETVWEHIRHSLCINKISLFTESELIVDAGTGGGLPGIPLAIAHPQKHFVLNDIVNKKAMAVRQMVQKLNLKNITVTDKSIEELKVQDPFLLISKHAFKINDLFIMTRHLPWIGMVFYKGLNFKKELKGIDTPLSVEVFKLAPPSGSEFYQDKALVVVQK